MNIEMSDLLVILNDFCPNNMNVEKEVEKFAEKFDHCFFYPEKEHHMGELRTLARRIAKVVHAGEKVLILTRSSDLLIELNIYIIAHGCSDKLLESVLITKDCIIDPKKCKAYTLQPNIQNLNYIYTKSEQIDAGGVNWVLMHEHIDRYVYITHALMWEDD